MDSTFVLQGNVTASSSTLAQAVINSNGGTFSLSGADRTFTVGDGPAENDFVINAPIIGSGGERLIKEGAGVMVMGGAFANSYIGFTNVRDGRLNLSKTVTPAIAGPLTIGDGVGSSLSAEVRLTEANQIADVMPVDVASDGLLRMNGLTDTIEALQINGGSRHRRPRLDLTTTTITLIGGTPQHRRRRLAAPDQQHPRDVDSDADRDDQRKWHDPVEWRDARAQRRRWSAGDRPARRRQHRGHRSRRPREDQPRRRAADRQRHLHRDRPTSATARCSSTAR